MPIRFFDVQSQRSIEKVKSITLYPASETIIPKDLLKKGLKAIFQKKKLKQSEVSSLNAEDLKAHQERDGRYLHVGLSGSYA